jgi:hypothetical protein
MFSAEYIEKMKNVRFDQALIDAVQAKIEETLYQNEEFVDFTFEAVGTHTGVSEEEFDSQYQGSADYDDYFGEREDLRALLISKALIQLAEGK